MSNHISDPVPVGRLRRLCRLFVLAILLLGVGVMASRAWRFLEDTPVDYADVDTPVNLASCTTTPDRLQA